MTISVPSLLSPDSYQDFADRMEILLRGLKRRSDAEGSLKEEERAPTEATKKAPPGTLAGSARSIAPTGREVGLRGDHSLTVSN